MNLEAEQKDFRKVTEGREQGASSPVTTWAEVKSDFEDYLLTHGRFQGRNRNTAQSYVRNVNLFAEWCQGRDVNPAAASKATVSGYIAELVKEGKLAHNTICLRLACIRAFYEFCRWSDFRHDDPCEGANMKWQTLPPRPAFKPDNLLQLLGGCRNERDRAMIWVAYSAGLRVAEIISLREHHIDFDTGLATIFGKGSKVRTVYLEAEVLEALRPLRGRKGGVLWWTNRKAPMSVKRAQRAIEQIAGRAGVTGAHWHRMRTTFANRALAAGATLEQVKVMMGHADTKTTAHYAGEYINSSALDAMKRLKLVERLRRSQ